MTTILEGENKIAPREALGSQEMWSRCPKIFACGAIYNGKITFSPLQQTQTTKKSPAALYTRPQGYICIGAPQAGTLILNYLHVYTSDLHGF